MNTTTPIDERKNQIDEYEADYLSTAPIESPKLPFPLKLYSPSNWVFKTKTINEANR